MKNYNDKITIRDRDKTITGFADIFDNKTNKYILKNRENLVTDAGRKFVKNILINNVFLEQPLDKEIEYEFAGIVFGNDSNLTTPEMVYVVDDYVHDYDMIFGSSIGGTNIISIDTTTDKTIKFTFTVEGKSTAPMIINNFALIIIEKNTPDNPRIGTISEILKGNVNWETQIFSRILIDPTPVNAESSHTISYTLFF